MKRIMIFILAAVTSSVIVITLFLAYRFFPQDTVVFDNKEYSIINDFDIRINGTEKVEYNELPHNLHLNYKDTVSMSTVLEEPLVAGAVLFFRTMETSVTVSINGQQVYEYGNGSRIFGRAPFRVWHFVELPDDYLGKEVVITLQPLLHPSSIPTTICPVGLSTKATALWDYFYPAFGFLLFLAVNMALISVGFLIFSLVLMQYDKNALRIFYFFLIFLHISLWGICNNSMITLFIGNAYFIYCLHYILHASLIIPISLYFGESYQKRYKKLAHGIVMFDTVKLLLLVLSELFTINTLAENIFIINATLFAELSILVAIAIKEFIHKNNENRVITYCLFGFTFLGLFEIVRLYVFGKTTITNALYYGAAIILSLGAIEAIYRYFNEAEKLSRLKIQNEETLHLLDIQQGYYQRISAQLHIARRVSHDFNHYNTLIYAAIQSRNTERLEKLLEKTSELYKEMQMIIYTECLEINSIISFAAETCAAKDIKFTPVLRELDFKIDLYDLCIIIGNMLDNAIEGALAVEKDRFVTFFTNRQENKFYIGVENSYSGNLNIVDGKLKTTKKDIENHGMGLSIIDEIIKKYNGEFWMDSEGNIFKTLIMISDC